MIIVEAATKVQALEEIGIRTRGAYRGLIARKTPQALAVKKLKAMGYHEVQWDQPQWEAYYDSCRQHNCGYIHAGRGANIMCKDNQAVIIGRLDLQHMIAVVEL